MYRIFYNGSLMHDPSLNDEKYIVIDPVMTEEANMAASLTFTIYPANARYNELERLLPGRVEVYDDSDLIFRGRIISDEQGWLNEKAVTCESELAYFNDSIIRPYSFQGSVSDYLRYLVARHNGQSNQPSKRFAVRTVTVTDPNNNIVRSSTQYPTAWTEIKEKLIDNLGGYLVVEWDSVNAVNQLDYLADPPTSATQKIELSKNLLTFSREAKDDDFITALIPLGAVLESSDTEEGEKRITIKSVNSGLDYIMNTEMVNRYGLIFGVEYWDDVTVPANLLTKARARLTERSTGKTTIELSALDLHLLDDNIHSLRFLTYVTVTDAEHDFSGRFLIKKKVTDMTHPGNSAITIGETIQGLSGYTSRAKADVETVVRDYVKNDKIVEVKESITEVSSELTQTASEIRAEVAEVQTDVDDLGTRVTSAEAAITVNATNISSKVSQSDYTGATIASLINQSASTVTIQAAHIKLEGAITANQTFSINNSGFMTATGGTIGGWSIGANVLTSSGTFTLDNVSTPYSVFMQAPATAVPGHAAFAVRFGEEGSYTYPFLVQYNGTLTATKANITGTINATGGVIGGWSVGSTLLQKFTAEVDYGYQYNAFLQAPESPTGATRAIGVQRRLWSGGSAGNWENVFHIDYSGDVYVSDINVSGTINGNGSGLTIQGPELHLKSTTGNGASGLLYFQSGNNTALASAFSDGSMGFSALRENGTLISSIYNPKVSGMAANGSVKSSNSVTWTSFDDTYTLSANHRYLVTYNVEFVSNATGHRLTRATIDGSTAGNIGSARQQAVSGNSTICGATFWIQASSSQRTLGFDEYQSSGGSLNGTLRYQVIDFGT